MQGNFSVPISDRKEWIIEPVADITRSMLIFGSLAWYFYITRSFSRVVERVTSPLTFTLAHHGFIHYLPCYFFRFHFYSSCLPCQCYWPEWAHDPWWNSKVSISQILYLTLCDVVPLQEFHAIRNAKDNKANNFGSATGTHNGFYYSWWTDNGAQATYTNGPAGQYSITWGTGGNLVGGKGWNPGTAR